MSHLPRAIQELSPTLVACLDNATGLVSFHNPIFSEKLRYDASQIQGQSIFQFVDEASFIPLAKALKSVKPMSEINLNVTLKKSNAEVLETKLQVCRRDEDDFLVYLFFIDIMAQVKKDKDLEVFQQIISSSKEMIALIDSSLKYQVVNQAYLKHFALKEQDVVGKHVNEIHAEKDIHKVTQALQQTLKDDKSMRFQLDVFNPRNDKSINIDSMLSPHHNTNGEVIGVIVCARDITAYVETSNSIQSSNRYYKTLFEYSPDLLASVNLQTGVILDANRTLESVLGYGESELTGQHLFKFHGKAHKRVLAEAIVKLSNNHPIHSLEVSLIAKDDSCISAELRTTPIVDEDSSIAIFVWRDTRYQEKLAFKAAHDPLTHILNRSGFMPLLEKPFEAEEKRVLCFLDIDNFKLLNDTSGHLSGDEFLIDMADLLKQNISSQDKLCRLGGDEFLVLVRERELDEVHKLMRVILLKINSLIKGQRKYLNAKLGISIGITPFNPGESSRTVLKRADQACYQSKNNGKNQISALDAKAVV